MKIKSKKSKKLYKLPPEAREEPETSQHSKYEEEPVKKGKTHYEEDELPDKPDSDDEI